MATRSLSSHAMTRLLEWRNPRGREENWADPALPQSPSIGKVLATEAALLLITTVAVVESAVYLFFTVVSLPTFLSQQGVCRFSANLLSSSSFTALWAITDLFFANICRNSLATHESFARFSTGLLVRDQDRHTVQEWERNHPRLVGIVRPGRMRLEDPADDLMLEVLHNINPRNIKHVRESEAAVYEFLLTQVAFLYVFGSRRNEALPDFFSQETKARITALRQKKFSSDQVANIKAALKLYDTTLAQDSGTTEVQAAEVHDLFIALKGACSAEMQSLLIRKHLANALKHIPQGSSSE